MPIDRILGRLQETRKIKEKVPDEDARKPALRQLLHKVSPGASSWSPVWHNYVDNEMDRYNVKVTVVPLADPIPERVLILTTA
jgi:hypothetical protein